MKKLSLIIMSIIFVSCSGSDDESSSESSFTTTLGDATYTCTTRDDFDECTDTGVCEGTCTCEGEGDACLSLEELIEQACPDGTDLTEGQTCTIDDVVYTCGSDGNITGGVLTSSTITIDLISLTCSVPLT